MGTNNIVNTPYAGRLSNCSHVDGPFHTCRYVEAVNRLIPRAQANADEVVRRSDIAPGPSGEHARNVLWNVTFHAEMTRLRVERKLWKEGPRS